MPGGRPGEGLDDQGREEDVAHRVDARFRQSNRKAIHHERHYRPNCSTSDQGNRAL